MKPTLYALIVGIDHYREDVSVIPGCRFRSLRACVSDAQSVKAYLEQDPYVRANIMMLTNEQATKANIQQAFETHLARATATDHVMFYFSGHGITEYADSDIWETETDGRLECLVCHNDGQTCLLADKELRYLLHRIYQYDYAGNPKVPPAHVLTVFDNCHSGDNTRAAAVHSEIDDALPRQLNCVAPQRPWSQFLFAENVEENAARNNATAGVFPAIPHVHLSACEPHEVAWEARGKGIFTYHLLKQLKKEDGRISYRELIARTRALIGNSRFSQTPILYVPESNSQLQQLFFNGISTQAASYTLLVYKQAKGWVLQAGILHGVRAAKDRLPLQMSTGEKLWVKVQSVQLDHSVVELPVDLSLDQDVIHRVILPDTLTAISLSYFIENVDYSKQEYERCLEYLQAHAPFMTLVGEEHQAQYVLRIRYNQVYVTLPLDPFRPLFLPVERSDVEQDMSELLPALEQLCETYFLQNLKLQYGSLSPLRIEVSIENEQGIFQLAEINEDRVRIPFFQQEDGSWRNAIRVSLTNTTQHPLYTSAIYYGADFSVYSGMLDPTVYIIEPGDTVHLWQHQSRPELTSRLPVIAQQYHLEYNWPYVMERLQFISSVERFEMADIQRKGLPHPLTVSRLHDDEVSRGSLEVEAENSADVGEFDWAIQQLDLQLDNPMYNTINLATLLALLRDERTSGFAMGLYLEKVSGWSSQYQLQSDISLLEQDEHTRSLLFDAGVGLANVGARINRNWKFRKHMRKYPERRLLVSEGDSWFQHPLVKDVIDHLGNFYNIYSVGAAGDEFRNYLMSAEFLDAISALQYKYNRPVDALLISGGGNDILGSQFVEYIHNFDQVESAEAGQDIERFFTDRYQHEMDSLMSFYDILFRHLHKHHPKLRIVTHGYDYVHPANPDSNKMSWLGKPMNQRGIFREADRQELVRHMIDRFNDDFERLADAHPNVTHVDVRGRVRDYQWYDEIHPNAEGFQEVALQFINRIDQVL